MMKFHEISEQERNIVLDLRLKGRLHPEFQRIYSGRHYHDIHVGYRTQKHGFTIAIVRIGGQIFCGTSKRMRTDRNSIRGRCLAFVRAVGCDENDEAAATAEYLLDRKELKELEGVYEQISVLPTVPIVFADGV